MPGPCPAAVCSRARRDLGDRGAARRSRPRAAAPPRPGRGPAGPGGSPRSAACRSPPSDVGRRGVLTRLRRGQQPQVVLAEAVAPAPRRSRPGPAASWVGDRASCTVPPLAQWQSMPSAAATRPTSSTRVLHRPVHGDRRRPGRPSWSSLASDAGNSAEHQPPLRPDAPNPAISRSQTAIRRPGLGAREVVGRPQAGEPGAGDGHVHLGVAWQRVGRDQRARHRVEPEGQGPVCLFRGHASMVTCAPSWPAHIPRHAGRHFGRTAALACTTQHGHEHPPGRASWFHAR